MIGTEINSMKLTRKTAKAMFPKEYAIGEAFEDKLKKLMVETLDEHKGDEQVVFGAITATMTMELAKLFATMNTEPVSVMKTFSEVMLAMYKEKLGQMQSKEEKKS